MNYTMRYTQYLSGILSEADFHEMGPDQMSNGAAPMAPQMGDAQSGNAGLGDLQGGSQVPSHIQLILDKLIVLLNSRPVQPNSSKAIVSKILQALPNLNHDRIMNVVRGHEKDLAAQ